eukprot:GEMP01002445.1.p1 GENE.GEMP01002445.1~~GEMP01002445.1.p1  ORF type:complete len:1268 (+),score=303.48 GEMP01002445.1:124-3927(+)
METWRQRLDESLQALYRDPEPLTHSPTDGTSTGPSSGHDDNLLTFGGAVPGASPRTDESPDPQELAERSGSPPRDRVPEQTTTRPARQNAYISLSAVPDLATTTTSAEPQAADHPLRGGMPNNVTSRSPASISPPHRVLPRSAQQPMAAVPKARARVQAAPDLQGSIAPAKAKAIAQSRRADTGGSEVFEVTTDLPPPHTIPDVVGFNFRASAGGSLAPPKAAHGVTTRRAPPNGRGATTTSSSMESPLRQFPHSLDPPGRSHQATDGDATAPSATLVHTSLEMPVVPGSSWERLAAPGSSRMSPTQSPEHQAVGTPPAADAPAESAYVTGDTSQQASNSNTIPMVKHPKAPWEVPGGDLGEGGKSFAASSSGQNDDTLWLHETPHNSGPVETSHYSTGAWEASYGSTSPVEEGFGDPQEECEGAGVQSTVQDGPTRQYRVPPHDAAFEPLYVSLSSWWAEDDASGSCRYLPTTTNALVPSEAESNRQAWTVHPSTKANIDVVLDNMSTRVDDGVIYYNLSPRVNPQNKPPYLCAEDAGQDDEETADDGTKAGKTLDGDEEGRARVTDAIKPTIGDKAPCDYVSEPIWKCEIEGAKIAAATSDKKENVGYFEAMWSAQKDAVKSAAPAKDSPDDNALRRFDDMWKSKYATINGKHGHVEAVMLSSPTAESSRGIEGQEPLDNVTFATGGSRKDPVAPNPADDYIHTYESVLWKHHAPTGGLPRNPLSELPLQDANSQAQSYVDGECLDASEAETTERRHGEGAWEAYERRYLNGNVTVHTAYDGVVNTSQPENTIELRHTSSVRSDPLPGCSYGALNAHHPKDYYPARTTFQTSDPPLARAHDSEDGGTYRALDAATTSNSMWARTYTPRNAEDTRRAESTTAYIVASLNRDPLCDARATDSNADTTRSEPHHAAACTASDPVLGSARSLLIPRHVEDRTNALTSPAWKDNEDMQSHDRFLRAHVSLRSYFQNPNPFDSLKMSVDAEPTLPARRNQYRPATEVAAEAYHDEVLVNEAQDAGLWKDMAERRNQDYKSSQRRFPVSPQLETQECQSPSDSAFEGQRAATYSALESSSVKHEPSRTRPNEPRTWVAPRNHFDGSVSTDWASRRSASPEYSRPASARLDRDRIFSPFACAHRAVRTVAHRTAARRYVARTFGAPNGHSPLSKAPDTALLAPTSTEEEDERLLSIKSRFAGLRQTLHGLLPGETRIPPPTRNSENGTEKLRRSSSMRACVVRADTGTRPSTRKVSRENPTERSLRSRLASKV